MSNVPLFINEFRSDGRKANENRPVHIKIDVIKNSTGSCEYTMGETKVIAWIEGPKDSRKQNQENIGNIKCYFTEAPFSYMIRKNDFKRDLKMKDFSYTLKNIFEEVIRLELYIKSEIIINALVLQNDGNFKGATVNAITMALINAGIYIKDTVIGMCVGVTEEEKVIYDLILSEEKNNIPIINVAFLPHSKKFIYTEIINSKIKYSKVEVLMKEAEIAAMLLYDEEEKYLKKDYINK